MSYEEIASYESVFNDIKRVLEQGRRRAIAHVNHEMLVTYWNVGRIIVEHEQENPDRAEYGAATLKRLSRELTETYGKGFSRSNLQNMRLLYLDYPICQTLSGKLSWSHYCELLSKMCIRDSIEPGSVGIGGAQTGIYPLASPGGWQIIGRTPLKPYDPDREKPILTLPSAARITTGI